MKEECLVSCFDLKSGKELWVARHAATEKAASNYMASRAAPTPTVDQRGVVAFFESGDCLAVDHNGQLLWHRSLTSDFGKFDNNHGLGASPTQTDDLFILNIEHKGPSYLIALEKSSGATRWKSERASSSSWSSPIVMQVGGETQVVVSSGGTVDGYSADNASRAGRSEAWTGTQCLHPRHRRTACLSARAFPEFGSDGQAAKSNLCLQFSVPNASTNNPSVAWRASKAISDYASPVVCQQCVYYLNKVGVLYCLDQKTGEAHYAERLGTQCWATPVVSEDRIYFFGKDGKTQIVRAGPKFDLIGSNLLWNPANPPKPETYVENNDRDHGQPGSADTNKDASNAGPRPAGGRGAGMLANLMKADADGDGQLSPNEVPAEFKPMLARIDTNADGTLDAAELKAMAESFAALGPTHAIPLATQSSTVQPPLMARSLYARARVCIVFNKARAMRLGFSAPIANTPKPQGASPGFRSA